MNLAADTIDAVGRCPHCGYDQRGLPAGSNCPECGRVFWAGAAMADINRWADRSLLNLWSIAVLLVVSIASMVTCMFAAPATAAAYLLFMMAVAYTAAATCWYVVTAVSFALRRSKASYTDLVARKRSSIHRWLAADAVLAGASVSLASLMWL